LKFKIKNVKDVDFPQKWPYIGRESLAEVLCVVSKGGRQRGMQQKQRGFLDPWAWQRFCWYAREYAAKKDRRPLERMCKMGPKERAARARRDAA